MSGPIGYNHGMDAREIIDAVVIVFGCVLFFMLLMLQSINWFGPDIDAIRAERRARYDRYFAQCLTKQLEYECVELLGSRPYGGTP